MHKLSALPKSPDPLAGGEEQRYAAPSPRTPLPLSSSTCSPPLSKLSLPLKRRLWVHEINMARRQQDYCNLLHELRNDEDRLKKVLFIIIEGLVSGKYQGWSQAITSQRCQEILEVPYYWLLGRKGVTEPVRPLNTPVQNRSLCEHSLYMPTCDVQGWKNGLCFNSLAYFVTVLQFMRMDISTYQYKNINKQPALRSARTLQVKLLARAREYFVFTASVREYSQRVLASV